jgi:tetratricopeptide (TPR) repeat protein
MAPRIPAVLLLAAASCAAEKQSWREALPSRTEVFVDVLPRKAEVRVDGAVSGSGPHFITLGEAPVALEVAAPGFDAARVQVDPHVAGGRVGVALRPAGWGAGRKVDIDEPLVLVAASQVLLRAGQAPEAADYAERAVELGPQLPTPRRALGMALAKLGKRSRAAQELSQYLQLTPAAADRAEVERLVGRLRGDMSIRLPGE